MTDNTLPSITVDRLAVGLYVHLDLGWMDHPFAFNHFKIRDAEQLETLRGLGLKTIRYDPKKSDIAPPPPGAAPPPPATPAPASAAENPLIKAKLERMERIKKQREAISACERVFQSAASTVKNIAKNLFSRPEETLKATDQLVSQMVESMLTERDIAIHLMNDKIGGEEVYVHSLNVSVLAMILAKEMGLPADKIKRLGMGAMFHDIGKIEIPDKILLKKPPLTRAETDFLRQHVAYGEDIGKRLNFAREVLQVITQHHEMMDGSGYPAGLKGDDIAIPARIVAMVNHYDNLCNPLNVADAITPHKALSTMFSKQRARFDATALKILIRSLGVFPPGTVVQLSNDAIGMVMTVNSSKPLKPSVLIYDPEVPKQEAIILDLETEEDLNIGKAIRPGLLPRDIYEYLSPRKRVTYYFNETDSKSARP